MLAIRQICLFIYFVKLILTDLPTSYVMPADTENEDSSTAPRHVARGLLDQGEHGWLLAP